MVFGESKRGGSRYDRNPRPHELAGFISDQRKCLVRGEPTGLESRPRSGAFCEFVNAKPFDNIMLNTKTVSARALPEGIEVTFAPAEEGVSVYGPQVYDLVLQAVGRPPTLGKSIGMAAEIAHGSCTDVPPQRK